MQIVTLENARAGMRLGRPVMDTLGRLVLQAGVTLNDRYIALLIQHGYVAVYIADDLTDVELPETVSQSTRQEVANCVLSFMSSGVVAQVAGTKINMPCPEPVRHSLHQRNSGPKRDSISSLVWRAAEILIDEVLSIREVMIGLVDLKSVHDALFTHAVQVALVSIVVGRVMGLTRPQLRDLGVGSLLHDVGRVSLPESIWNKSERLSATELKEVQSHAKTGFDIIQASKVGLLPAHVAFQHHERFDGSGYPRGLSGTDIIKYARICAVCDVFDAMTSDRPHRKALHPYEALTHLRDEAGKKFDPEVVKALSSVVAPYPVATSVKLNTGEIAVVKRLHRRAMDKPVVLITRDSDGRLYGSYREVDLSKCDTIHIIGYVYWYEYSQPEETPTGR